MSRLALEVLDYEFRYLWKQEEVSGDGVNNNFCMGPKIQVLGDELWEILTGL